MRTTEVYLTDNAGWQTHIGTANFSNVRSQVTTTFSYANTYLANPHAYAIDPALPLVKSQHIIAGLPGAMRDSAPDAWGRNLIEHQRRYTANHYSSDEVDFLLASDDFARIGNLRYAVAGTYVNNRPVIPKLIHIAEIMGEADKVMTDPNALEAIKQLLDVGSNTLGGARPKASVIDGDNLLLAKFPSPTDTISVINWEAATLDMAKSAGIDIPGYRLITVAGKDVLLLDRFDRDGLKGRLGYLSARTMFGTARADYHDFPDMLSEICSDVNYQLAQMWRRIAFNVLVHNTDDHLRNHGLLRGDRGWVLSPAFDMNPTLSIGTPRQTPIAGAVSMSAEIPALLDSARSFRLSYKQASAILKEVFEVVRDWSKYATDRGIPSAEIDAFTQVFTYHNQAVRKI